MAHLLMVSRDASLQSHVGDIVAAKRHCRLESVEDLDLASVRIRRGDVSLALLKVSAQLPVSDGVRFVNQLATLPRPVPALVIMENDDAEASLSLVKAGAVECMSRPLNTSRLSMLIDLLTARDRAAPNRPAKPLAGEDGEVVIGNDQLLISSPTMRSVAEQVRAVAPLDATILLTGETGSGKTSLARWIHQLSPRSAQRLLTVNCGALPETLIESELFGHVRGAFTGADREKKGKFFEAQAGTLLLDDVNCIPLAAQAALLRAVEDRVYEPVGSNGSQPFQARLIATCNLDLRQEALAGRFRADLYFRLNVASFHVPPLRDRRDEIGVLAQRFLELSARRHALACPGISHQALQQLITYDWPGNIRELQHVIERAVILCGNCPVELRHLPEQLLETPSRSAPADAPAIMLPPTRSPLAQARWDAERTALEVALHRNQNNRTCTAQDLGISRAALYKKLQKYGLVRPEGVDTRSVAGEL